MAHNVERSDLFGDGKRQATWWKSFGNRTVTQGCHLLFSFWKAVYPTKKAIPGLQENVLLQKKFPLFNTEAQSYWNDQRYTSFFGAYPNWNRFFNFKLTGAIETFYFFFHLSTKRTLQLEFYSPFLNKVDFSNNECTFVNIIRLTICLHNSSISTLVANTRSFHLHIASQCDAFPFLNECQQLQGGFYRSTCTRVLPSPPVRRARP